LSILLNDFSLAGQFTSTHAFLQSLELLMKLRQVSECRGYKLECSSTLVNNQVTNELTLYEAIQSLQEISKKRSVMAWITKAATSWGQNRLHNDDDYLICNDEVVTGTAIGEAAYRNHENKESSLVSFAPSDWMVSPINVDYFYDNENKNKSCAVKNYWTVDSLTDYLDSILAPIQSWKELEKRMRSECEYLNFSEDSFSLLFPQPFVTGASDRIVVLLRTLDRYSQCFDERGNRTDEGNEIYQNYFTGDRARFTDSSDDEKRRFENELKFALPDRGAAKVLCPWHGKIQTPQLRIHFAWPEQNGGNFDVVYIGPKITKR